jgi:aspartate aminotransferase-like enzyme
MHIKKQHPLTPGPTPLYPKALHAMMDADLRHCAKKFQGSGVAAVQRAYAECAIAKKETVNA